MRRLLVRSFVLATCAVAVGAGTAHAQSSYPPETLSTAIAGCTEGDISIVVDGAVPGSAIKITIDFQGAPDVVANEVANAVGFFIGTYPLPVNSGQSFTVTIEGLDWTADNPKGTPFVSVLPVDRTLCPDLPNTGSESLPIGKLALGVSLAGALLAVVAIRRRPHDDETPADPTAASVSS